MALVSGLPFTNSRRALSASEVATASCSFSILKIFRSVITRFAKRALRDVVCDLLDSSPEISLSTCGMITSSFSFNRREASNLGRGSFVILIRKSVSQAMETKLDQDLPLCGDR